MLDFLSKIDSFGQVFYPTYDKKTKFTNSLGGIFTLITFCIAAGCIWGFGNEIYYKRNPRVNTNTQISKRRRNFTLQLPISFIIEVTGDKYGAVKDWERYIDIKAFYMNSTLVSPSNLVMTSHELSFRKCSLNTDFSESLSYEFNFNNLDKSYCFQEDILIGGFWNNEYVKNIRIEVTPCKNSTKNSNHCYPKEKLEEFLDSNDKQLGIYYQNIIFDSNDFGNPYQYYFDAIYIKLESQTCKLLQMEIKEVNLTTDYFPMWEMTYSHYYQSVDRVIMDSYSPYEGDNCLLKVYLYTSDRADKIKRTYLKLQEVLAQLGGILSIFMIVFESVIRITYQRRMNEEVIRVLFEIDDEEIIKDVQDKLKLKKATNICKTIKKSNFYARKDTVENHQENMESVRNINTDGSQENADDHKKEHAEKNENNQENKEEKGVIKNENNTEEVGIAKVNNKPDTIIDNREIHYFFSLCDNLCLVFCFRCSGKRLRRLDAIYSKLHEFTLFYTDVLHMAKKISEIDKLKYIIFSKKQLAYFNHVCKLENPLKKGRPSRLTEFYRYSLDPNMQTKDIGEYLKKLSTIEKKSRIDRKLERIWE